MATAQGTPLSRRDEGYVCNSFGEPQSQLLMKKTESIHWNMTYTTLERCAPFSPILRSCQVTYPANASIVMGIA